MNLSRWKAGSALLAMGALGLAGCDKLKATMSHGTDAGAASSGGGGILSFLGSDFEGEITMNLSSKTKAAKSGPQQIVFDIKKPKYRLDMSSPTPSAGDAGSLLIDLPTKKGYMLMHGQKTAMVIDFEKLKTMPKGQPIPGLPIAPKAAPAAPSQPPKIDKTGKKDTVAGYTCEIWNVTSESQKAQICAAEGITWIDLGDLGMSSPEIALAAVTSEANRFPLRVITYDPKGAEEMRMETTKVDKKKIDDARFAVPADYKVLDLSALMGGLPLPGVTPSSRPPHR